MAGNAVSAAACHPLAAGKQGFGDAAANSGLGRSWGSVFFSAAAKRACLGPRRMLACTNRLVHQVPPVPVLRAVRIGAVPGPAAPAPLLMCFLARAADGEADAGSSKGVSVVESEALPRSEADKLVDGMTFSQLCDEFECTSSPAVEQTARLIAKELLGVREGNRAAGIYAAFVKYKDPLRSFQGRETYKRPSWADGALENSTVSITRMVMQSTSVLKIYWTLRGKPRLPGVDQLVLKVVSTYTLNQISGQVTEHEEEWDLSASSLPVQLFFWSSRLAYTAVQLGKDAALVAGGVRKLIDSRDEDSDSSYYYQDPSGDPRKFFVEDNFQRDVYQIGLVIALLYLAVQFLRLTL